MVIEKSALYLLIGQDHLSKDVFLKQLKDDLLRLGTEQFNQDILYAKELVLRVLQERLLLLPVGAKKRIVVVRGAEKLKNDLREFILQYAGNPYPGVILVLDADTYAETEEFAGKLSKKSCRVERFKEAAATDDAFTLSRHISEKRTAHALKVLGQLLKNGEKPERILGGLRYVCEKGQSAPRNKAKTLKLILNCDLEIKTGRLRPNFALEKLIVGLAGSV